MLDLTCEENTHVVEDIEVRDTGVPALVGRGGGTVVLLRHCERLGYRRLGLVSLSSETLSEPLFPQGERN